jgi:hypothetical protein
VSDNEQQPSLRETIEQAAEGKFEELGIEKTKLFDDALSESVQEETQPEQLETKEITNSEEPSFADTNTENVTEDDDIELPVGWKADKKELWKSTPPEIREYIMEREEERNKGFYRGRQEFAEIDRVTEPYKEELKRAGVPLSKAIEQAFAWNKYLEQNPHQALMDLSQRLGVDLRSIGQVVQAAEPQDPYVRQMYETTAQMQARLEAMEREREMTYENSIKSEVNAFMNRKDASGKLMFPYAEELSQDIISLMPLVRGANPEISTQQLLEESYTRAMRANPNTWTKYQKQLEQKQKEDSKQRLQKVKNASLSVTGSQDTAQSRTPPTGIREIMEAYVNGTL